MNTQALPLVPGDSRLNRYHHRVDDMRELLNERQIVSTMLHDLLGARPEQDHGSALREQLEELDRRLLQTGLDAVIPG